MSNIDDFYTYSEKTVKKYTVYQAIQSARRTLGERFKTFCSNAVTGREESEKITLKELNEIADQIVRDTKYYA